VVSALSSDLRIDSHHSFSERYPLAHLESILRRNRFEGSVLVSSPPDPLPDFIQGIVVPEVAMLDHPRVRGVIHRFSDGALPEWLRQLEDRNLSLDVLDALPLISHIAETFPRLHIAVTHLGSPPFENWYGHLQEASRHPNVYCKLSGLLRIPDARSYVRQAMSLFPPDRLMFGSDWPNSLPDRTWKENLAAFTQAIGAQAMEIREQLLGGTAAAFYRLTAQS
jgi:L-fuconolactonase